MPRLNPETKLSAYIDADVYHKVSSQLQWGQLTQLIRCLMHSLVLILKDAEATNDMYLYINGRKPLTLPVPKEE